MRRWFVLLAAGVIAAVFGLWQRTARDGDQPGAPLAVARASPVDLATPLPSLPQRSPPGEPKEPLAAAPALPASLAGTEVDGTFPLDDQGRLVVNDDVRRLFDYFLATLGEIELDEVRALVRAQARRDLEEEALVEAAMSLFDQYLTYLEALQSIADASAPDGADLHDQFSQVQRLQAEVFDRETAAALLGKSNQVTRAVLARYELGPRNAYQGDDYEHRLAEAEAALPPATRAALQRDRDVVHVREQVRRMRARGASDREIWQLRARFFGSAAADRLAALDRARD